MYDIYLALFSEGQRLFPPKFISEMQKHLIEILQGRSLRVVVSIIF
jgi:hypothetical protein